MKNEGDNMDTSRHENDAAVLMYNNMYDGQEINGGSAYDEKSTEHKSSRCKWDK
jgi:hypothetical protein